MNTFEHCFSKATTETECVLSHPTILAALGIYPREAYSCVHSKTWERILTAALFEQPQTGNGRNAHQQ